MSTILFGNPEKYNLLAQRPGKLLAPVLLILVCLISSGSAQGDWTSPLEICWQYKSEFLTREKLASDNEYIFVPTSQGSIVALDQRNGSLGWEADLAGISRTHLLLQNSSLFVSATFEDENGSAKTVLRSVNPDSGVPYWEFSGVNPLRMIPLAISSEQLLVGDENGRLALIDSNGRTIWNKQFQTTFTTSAVSSNDRVVLGTSNKSVLVLDGKNGAILTQINVGSVPESLAFTPDGKILFVGSRMGTISALRTVDFQNIWNARTGAGIVSFSLFNGDLIVASKDNFVYRILSRTGKKLWKRKLAGRILGGTAIGGNFAVFLSTGAPTALVLDLENGNLVNKITFDSDFVSGPVRTKTGFSVPTTSSIIGIRPGGCG